MNVSEAGEEPAAAVVNGKSNPVQVMETEGTNNNHKRGGCWLTFTRFVNRSFSDATLEELYQEYRQRTKASDLDCFFLTGCLVAVHSAVAISLDLQSGSQVKGLVCAGLSSLLAVAQAAMGFYTRSRRGRVTTGQTWLTYTAWTLANLLIHGLLFLPVSADRPLTWLLLVNFLTCVTLPLRLHWCFGLTFVSSSFFVLFSAFFSYTNQQVG